MSASGALNLSLSILSGGGGRFRNSLYKVSAQARTTDTPRMPATVAHMIASHRVALVSSKHTRKLLHAFES